jgi:hypothetical protein
MLSSLHATVEIGGKSDRLRDRALQMTVIRFISSRAAGWSELSTSDRTARPFTKFEGRNIAKESPAKRKCSQNTVPLLLVACPHIFAKLIRPDPARSDAIVPPTVPEMVEMSTYTAVMRTTEVRTMSSEVTIAEVTIAEVAIAEVAIAEVAIAEAIATVGESVRGNQ